MRGGGKVISRMQAWRAGHGYRTTSSVRSRQGGYCVLFCPSPVFEWIQVESLIINAFEVTEDWLRLNLSIKHIFTAVMMNPPKAALAMETLTQPFTPFTE